MSSFLHGLGQAFSLVLHGDPYLMHLTLVTLLVAAVSTGLGLVIGLPVAVALGVGRFRGRGFLTVVANAGLGLPPVVVGLVLSLMMFPSGPLYRFHLLFTLEGVYVAQTVLALPVVIALSASAIRDLPAGLVDQARAFGASRVAVALFVLREARIGVLAATIAAIGSALSEVGAVVLVGGNIENVDQTLASAALMRIDAGDFVGGLAIGIILLGLILVVVALLTALQYGARRRRVAG